MALVAQQQHVDTAFLDCRLEMCVEAAERDPVRARSIGYRTQVAFGISQVDCIGGTGDPVEIGRSIRSRFLRDRRSGEDPLEVFNKAIDNAKPLLQVKSRRVGGATYQVPVEVAPSTRTAIAFRWIIEFSRKRGEKTMKERLAAELIDCYNRQGSTIKRREDTHRMAEANKAFAHFRF